MDIDIKTNWNEIDVETFIELKTIDDSEYNTYFSNKLERLAVITGTLYNDDIWNEMDCDDIENLYDKIKFINNDPPKNFKTDIGIFKYKGVRNITIGEYIDLNKWCSDNFFKNLDLILSVLYRKYKYDEFDRLVFEDYNFNINERKNDFHEFIISDVYGVLIEFINFKKEIENNYTDIFQSIPDGDDEIEENLSPEEKLIIKREIDEEKKQLNWVWENIIYNLSGQDIVKMKDVFNLKAIFVFNMIAYNKSMN